MNRPRRPVLVAALGLSGPALALAPPGAGAQAPPTRMVPFPSVHLELVIGSTSTREILSTGAVRSVFIAERPDAVALRVTVRQAGKTWVSSFGARPTQPGGTVLSVAVPPQARARLRRCLAATVEVAAYRKTRTPVATDTVSLLKDQPLCARRPPSLSVPARPPAGQQGLALPSTFMTESRQLMTRDLDGAKSLRAKWLRIPIDWNQIQPTPARPRWSAADRVIAGATARGIGTLGLITYTPPWAQAPGASYPRDPVRFAAFAARAAARYAPYGVRHWEIWNEPNFANFWKPVADPAAYARMLRVTSVALHAVQSRAVVMLGGLARVDFDGTSIPANLFLEQALRSGVLPQTDAIAVHPYSFPFLPGDPTDHPRNAWRLIEQPVDGLLALLRLADQAEKPLWITEFGAPDQGSGAATGAPDGVGAAEQAATVTRLYAATRGTDWAGPAFWYAGRDLGRPGNSVENYFGLLRSDFSEKPAAAAYRALAP